MIANTVRRFEAWLRLDPVAAPMTAARGRAIYALAGIFAFAQALNLVGMTIDYGGWIVDHTVAVGSVGVVLGTVVALRYCRAFAVYAGFYTVAMVIGVGLSSRSVGINSALLPMLVWVPFVCGMIAGWRSVVVGTATGLGLTVWLYGISLGDAGLAGFGSGRIFQRFVQTSLALLVSGVMAAVFSNGLRTALTSLRETAQRAQRAEAAKSDFLAQMSHELRTPLNGVIGLADALAASDLGKREQALTETIRGSGQSLLAILNDLLDLSKIEAGKLRLEPAPFSPAALLESVAETWRESAATRATTVEVALGEAVPDWLLGDELRIRQVLNNFASNAVKFTEGGRVTLSLDADPAPDGASLVFKVADTGRGIPKPQQSRVFEPFEQGEAGTTKRYGGTGLGLPICRELARLMDGDVELVRSDERGTVFAFIVRLPSASAPPVRQAAVDDGRLAGLRVLVAEDNAVNRMVAAEFLKALGVEAVFAENGREAVDAARLGGFDAVLMDKHMPELDGVAATRAIRALDGEAATVPIIAVTADAMAGEREALLAEGLDNFLSKPLRLDALRAALAAAKAPGGKAESVA